MGTKTASGRGLLARLLKQDRRLTLPAGAAEYPGAEALTTAARVVDHPLTSAGIGAGMGTGMAALLGASAGPALGVGAAGAGLLGGGQMLARAINNRHMAGRINKALNVGVSPTALMGNAQTRNYNRIAAILRDEARLNEATPLAEKLAPAAKVVGAGIGVGAGGNALLRLMSGKESTASVKFASPLRGPALEVPAAAPLRSLDTVLPQYPVSKLIGSRLTAPVISGTLGLAGGPVTAAASAAQSGLISHVTRGASERTIAGRMRKALMDGLPTDAYLTGNQRRVHRAVQTAEALSAPARLTKGKAALLAALGLGAGAGAVGLLGGSEKTAETYNQRYGRRTDAWLGTKRPEGPSSPGAAFNAISNAFKQPPQRVQVGTTPAQFKQNVRNQVAVNRMGIQGRKLEDKLVAEGKLPASEGAKAVERMNQAGMAKERSMVAAGMLPPKPGSVREMPPMNIKATPKARPPKIVPDAFKPSPAAPKTSTKPKVMRFTEREVGTIGGPTGPNMSMPRPAPKPAPAPSKNMSMPRPAPISSEEPRVGPTTEHVNFSRGDTVTARPPKIVPGKPIINEGIREVNFSRKNPVNIDNPFGKRLPRVAKKKKNMVLQLDGYGKVDLSGYFRRKNKSHLEPPKNRVASK